MVFMSTRRLSFELFMHTKAPTKALQARTICTHRIHKRKIGKNRETDDDE
jgi:hypothetical protein